MNLVDAIAHALASSDGKRPEICNETMRERLRSGGIGMIAINVARSEEEIRISLSEVQMRDETWEVFLPTGEPSS